MQARRVWTVVIHFLDWTGDCEGTSGWTLRCQREYQMPLARSVCFCSILRNLLGSSNWLVLESSHRLLYEEASKPAELRPVDPCTVRTQKQAVGVRGGVSELG